MDTTTTTETTATAQPVNALAAFQQRATRYQADKAEAARKAREKEEAEKNAAPKPAAKTPTVPPADQRPREREWIVPLAAVPTLQRVRSALAQAGEYDDTLRRELWDAIERELDTCPLARAEFHREKVVEGLKRLSSRFLPWDMVERICKMRIGREVTQEEATGLIEAKTVWKAHGKEMEGKEGHDPKKCSECLKRPNDVFRTKRPTGPNSQQDFNFIIQRGGELEPYAKLVYGALKDWQVRSYEARENRQELHKAFGVTPGKTLADVAAGNCPGCVVSAYIPRHLAVETTGRDGRVYNNFGEFFVYQMTEEELRGMGIRLPAGAAALQLVFPNNERESEMYREASKMAFVALGFGDTYSYSTASSEAQPFYGMRAHHNGREYAATNRGGINLRDVLVRGLPRKEGTVEEVAQAAQDVTHVLEEMQELVAPQSQPRSHDGFGSPRFQKGSKQEGRRHKGGRPEEDGSRRPQNPQNRGY